MKVGFVWRGGKRVQRYQCQNCGFVMREPKEVAKEKKSED